MIKMIAYDVIDKALSPNDLGVIWNVIDDYLSSLVYQDLLGIPKIEISWITILAHWKIIHEFFKINREGY